MNFYKFQIPNSLLLLRSTFLSWNKSRFGNDSHFLPHEWFMRSSVSQVLTCRKGTAPKNSSDSAFEKCWRPGRQTVNSRVACKSLTKRVPEQVKHTWFHQWSLKVLTESSFKMGVYQSPSRLPFFLICGRSLAARKHASFIIDALGDPSYTDKPMTRPDTDIYTQLQHPQPQ